MLLQAMSQSFFTKWWFEATFGNSFRGETIPLQSMPKSFFTKWSFDKTFENSFRGETISLQWMSKSFLRNWKFEETFENSFTVEPNPFWGNKCWKKHAKIYMNVKPINAKFFFTKWNILSSVSEWLFNRIVQRKVPFPWPVLICLIMFCFLLTL